MTGLQISALILVGAFMLFFFFFAVVIGDRITHEQRLISRRVGLVVGEKPTQEKKKTKRISKEEEESNTYIAKQNVTQKIADIIFEQLLAADIMMKPEEFVLIWISIAFIPALLAGLFSGNPMLPVVLFVLCGIAPVIYIKNKQGKRVKAFESQLSDALLICCNCLRSGLTFAQAMENIADEMEAPIGTEFKRSVSEMNYGATLDEALNSMLDRIDSSDLVFTVAAVSIQRQTGGNLSEILEIIANTIRERGKVKAEIKTLTTQGKASGVVIGILPIALGMILAVINPDYMMTFFNTTAGNIMLLVSVILEVVGFIAINKVVDIKY